MLNPAVSKILSDPLYFPFKLLADKRIGFLTISEDTFNQSVFLDRRIQGADRKMLSLNALTVGNQLKELKINAKKDLIHIFHISHVGSTFISKLLESLGEIKILREPNILRDLNQEFSKLIRSSSEYKKSELDLILSGILRSFLLGNESKVVLKHTSSNLSLPVAINQLDYIKQKEILLYTNLRDFLSHSVTSIGLKSDAEGSLQTRANQFNKISFSNFLKPDELQYLEIVSLIWMVEFSKMLSRKVSNQHSMLINFDVDFKGNSKERTLRKIIEYIFDGDDKYLKKIMDSHHWNINPKNGKEYNFSHREEAIKKNYLSSKADINKVINWVEGICKEEPYLMPLLEHTRQ